jgi:hypothetical protein
MPACSANAQAATIRVAERAKGVFRARTVAGPAVLDQDVPGVAYGSESGFSPIPPSPRRSPTQD